MKYLKALEQIFYVIPADKISWTEKWHFAPLCSAETFQNYHWSGNSIKYLQVWKMNMDHLLDQPYVNRGNLSRDNTP